MDTPRARTRATPSPSHAPTSRARGRLARAWPAALVVVLIAACLWFYGLGAGGTFYFKVAQAPLRPAADAPYYRESLLHVGLAHLLGFSGSLLAFRLFVLSAFWAALLYLAAIVRRRLSPIHAAIVLCVLAFHPSAMIAHAWTCHPDAPTYLLTALLMFARRPGSAAVIAAVGAWNHAAMWLVICVQTILLWSAFAEPRARARALAVSLGYLVGVASLKGVLALSGVQIADDRLTLAANQSVAALARQFTDAGWPIVYTLHFAHLLWLPSLVVVLGRTDRRAGLAVLAAQVLALAAASVTEDTTRVFAFLAWGSLLYGLVHALDRESPAARRPTHLPWLLAVTVAVTIAAPKLFAWRGALHDTSRAREHLRGLLSGAGDR
ncbi:hypothetical protein [Nannocystis sp. SCPEA4]|uniref:hypothetical protein n=1 Tax=Nannocystis sp. SCPEA4 TaxID=2996787 RepID=UPI002270FDCE|nr:hypothetical protein [Nannocystis sp. SCPEA4]MCY1054915.1 hypothetical protein [Nannocystis sp. SCPEA4]